MKNKLFRILFSHTAPKHSKVGVETYITAKDVEDVYFFVDEKYNYGCWNDQEEENQRYDIYNDDYEVIGTESFKEKIIRIKGEMNDEDYDYSDAYYGITLYGWEFVKEINDEELLILTNLGVVTSSKS